MHFCSECDNMYYLKLGKGDDDVDRVIYYCKRCGHEETIEDTNNLCVLQIKLKKNKQKYNHIINRYTKHDPTLPRITNISCPNKECDSNTSGIPQEIIYIRYDDIDMKYVYLCAVCDYVWETNKI